MRGVRGRALDGPVDRSNMASAIGEGDWSDERQTRTRRINKSDSTAGACRSCNSSKKGRETGRGVWQY